MKKVATKKTFLVTIFHKYHKILTLNLDLSKINIVKIDK